MSVLKQNSSQLLDLGGGNFSLGRLVAGMVDAKTLLYRFTVEDPETWEHPWTGEYTWPATDAKIYEYACHEANYALGDILRGARVREAEASAKE